MKLIDANALIQIIDDWRENIVETYGTNDEYAKVLGDVIDIIDSAPTIEERKKGKWEYPPTNGVRPFGFDTVYCTECGFFTVWDNNYNYCPNCGADMRKEKTDG